MDEVFRLEIPNLSRAEFLDLKRSLPADTVTANEPEGRTEALGALDPVTATLIVTLGLASIKALAAYLTKNRVVRTHRVTRVLPDGTREVMTITIDEATSDADVVAAVTKNMPKSPKLSGA